MKLKHIINVFIGLTFVWISTSCESYLDKLPDNRANLNSEDNITDLLVSAYPTVAICMLGEASSDNIKDNGINYGTLNQVVEEYYRWQPSTQKIGRFSDAFMGRILRSDCCCQPGVGGN